MFKRRDFATVVLVTYLILIILFCATKEKKMTNNGCTYFDTCVRFCCLDGKLCTNKYIRTHFNGSEIPKTEGRENFELKIFFGLPQCPLPLTLLDAGMYEFDPKGYIKRRDGLKGEPFYFGSNDFCLEGWIKNDDDNGTVNWDAWFCKDPLELRMTIHNYLMAAAWIFIATTLVAYVTSKSFETVAGRSEFMFLLGLLLFYAAYALYDNEIVVHTKKITHALLFASSMMFLWMTVLNFEIWWTFRYQIETQDVSRRFKVYCFYVFGFIGFLTLLIIAKWLRIQALKTIIDISLLGVLSAVFIISIADIVLLLLAGFMVAQLSKSPDIDQAWFEAQKERYWSYLGVYSVLFIIWPWTILSGGPFSFGQSIVVGFMRFSSAVFVFFILGFKKLRISIKRYSSRDVADNEVLL